MRERAAAWGAVCTLALAAVIQADVSTGGKKGLPGLQQEGLCLDGQGRLWIADDRAGTLMRFERLPAR